MVSLLARMLHRACIKHRRSTTRGGPVLSSSASFQLVVLSANAKSEIVQSALWNNIQCKRFVLVNDMLEAGNIQ